MHVVKTPKRVSMVLAVPGRPMLDVKGQERKNQEGYEDGGNQSSEEPASPLVEDHRTRGFCRKAQGKQLFGKRKGKRERAAHKQNQ